MSFTNKTTEAFQLVANRLNTLYQRDEDINAAMATLQAELDAAAATANAAAVIDDSAPSTTTVYSSNKVMTEIAASVADALEGNDVSNLADAIGALEVAKMGLISADAAQSFSDVKKAQARTNISAGSAEDVAENAADINNNTSQIASNVSDIAATVADTDANTTAIAGHSNDISNLGSGVSANSGNITQLQTDLGDEASYDPVAAMNAILTF